MRERDFFDAIKKYQANVLPLPVMPGNEFEMAIAYAEASREAWIEELFKECLESCRWQLNHSKLDFETRLLYVAYGWGKVYRLDADEMRELCDYLRNNV